MISNFTWFLLYVVGGFKRKKPHSPNDDDYDDGTSLFGFVNRQQTCNSNITQIFTQQTIECGSMVDDGDVDGCIFLFLSLSLYPSSLNYSKYLAR